MIETVHSWVPVGRGELDHLVGVARAKDLLAPLLTGQFEALEAFIRPPVVVPESIPALQVLERFRQHRSQLKALPT